MRAVGLLTALAVLAATPVCAAPDVQVENLGPGRFAVTVTASGLAEVAKGERLLYATARRLCRRQPFRLETVELGAAPHEARDGGAGEQSLVLTREVTCVDESGAAASPTPVRTPG